MPCGTNPTAGTLRTEDAIELGHAYLRDRIRLVDYDDHVVLPADDIVGASQDGNPGRCVTFQPLVGEVIVKAGFMRDADVGQAEI